VTFDLCKSTDPDKDALSFFFDFGDGSKASGSCIETHTYQASLRGAADTRAQDKSYAMQGCVVDPGILSACRSRTVTATTPTPPCPAPTVSITAPKFDDCFKTPNVPVSATATGASSVLFISDEINCKSMATTDPDEASTQVTGPGPTYSTIFAVGTVGTIECYRIRARAFASCGSSTDAAPVPRIFVDTTFPGCPVPFAGIAPATAAWSSDLAVEKGRLQVTVNGGAVVYAEQGRSYATSPLADGENHVEATLVAAAGKPGLWRFDLVGIEPGAAIRVLAGEVANVTGEAVTFRLQGTPGERVAFDVVRK
jgi:hypothetical protein